MDYYDNLILNRYLDSLSVDMSDTDECINCQHCDTMDGFIVYDDGTIQCPFCGFIWNVV